MELEALRSYTDRYFETMIRDMPWREPERFLPGFNPGDSAVPGRTYKTGRVRTRKMMVCNFPLFKFRIETVCEEQIATLTGLAEEVDGAGGLTWSSAWRPIENGGENGA